jgi:hypothetical protein
MTDADPAITIPNWPGLARQFASKCGPVIDRVLQDSPKFDAGFNFSDAQAMTLIAAARARAVNEIQTVTERRETAAAVANKLGALFEEICNLVSAQGAATIFKAAAECARHEDFRQGHGAQA